MKKALSALLAAGLTLALGACASDESDTPSSATATSGAAIDPAVAALNGTITFGTEGTYAPFSYYDTATGKLVGYDVEVAEAVAAKLGLKVEFVETAWDGIFAALEAGRFTAVANEVEINEKRQGLYDLSDPYSISYPVALTLATNTDITTVADLSGKTAAQTAGSNWGAKAEAYGATVNVVPGFAESALLVSQGRADFTLNDALSVADYFTATGDTSLHVAIEITEEQVFQGFALKKGSGLLPALNAALAELKADGTLAAIGDKYFGKDISQP
ncbi:MAG: transporter substrate-binding domain-containing protein [Propionibacteriaceae bacterium]|jgi:ABC-type amino acid transport substrate-binding protein|nr:transporter substrate-binding domain-containing protein [Propionibacteriaceae bacterium]